MAAPKVRQLIPGIPINEQRGDVFAQQLIAHIAKRDGRYLRDEACHFHVIIDGRRISLAETADNHFLAELMLEACKISTLSPAARAAIQRLQVEAARKAGQMQLKRFSALSSDGTRLYVPLDGGKLLLITADSITCTENGENQDHFWLEHPGCEPLRYSPGDVAAGLADFERLLVDTQACSIPAMRWLVAMQAGLFPYIRHSCPARFLLELIGPTQSGKTSGAERFTLLHGLGDVKGDFTVAGLAALGDIGLLVLDNREQANFNQPLIDFCLFLSTGADRGRAQVDGQLRPSETGPAGLCRHHNRRRREDRVARPLYRDPVWGKRSETPAWPDRTGDLQSPARNHIGIDERFRAILPNPRATSDNIESRAEF